jgi:uncharacterized protein YdbL (DUF1318 family)
MHERWVLLVYRIPREPSTPRIAVWRRLRRLGVAQLGDGLVGLPSDARNREHLEWIAEEVVEAGGTAAVWLAEPQSNRHTRSVVQEMAAARAAEYRQVIDGAAAAAATVDPVARRRFLRRLRRQLREIRRRDYFPPPEREQAGVAVQRLADRVGDTDPAPSSRAAR